MFLALIRAWRFGDIKAHCSVITKNLSCWKEQKTLLSFTSEKDSTFKNKVTHNEVIVTNFLVQHNLLIFPADHIGPLFKSIFHNSRVASACSCCRTETTITLNEALSTCCHNFIVEHCRIHTISLGTDGSKSKGWQSVYVCMWNTKNWAFSMLAYEKKVVTCLCTNSDFSLFFMWSL